ncbi:hypothetical protein GOODEAATRI_016197, partial [Goodea atripinnis]
ERMAEQGQPTGDLPPQSALGLSQSSGTSRQNSSDKNGHIVDSPDDETLSPTSVIYFKEALNSSNLKFVDAGPVSAAPLRQYDFRIERIDSKRRRISTPLPSTPPLFLYACTICSRDECAAVPSTAVGHLGRHPPSGFTAVHRQPNQSQPVLS